MTPNEPSAQAPSPRGGARPGAGRKKAPPRDRKTYNFSCKLNKEQALWLEDRAFELGGTPSAVLREMVEKAAKSTVFHGTKARKHVKLPV